jgi:hypothetical protein
MLVFVKCQLEKFKLLAFVFLCLSTGIQAQTCDSFQVFNYNEFTGSFILAGAKTLSGTSGSATGTLTAAISNGGPGVALPGTGNFLGVKDGNLVFFDPVNMTTETYNSLTGALVFENSATTLLPVKGVSGISISPNDEPQAGGLVRAMGTRNISGTGEFIDMGDDDLVYKDSDGSLSSYYNVRLSGTCGNAGQGILLTDPTWTTFTGGPAAGEAPSKANILAIEDGYIWIKPSTGSNQLHYYFYATGTYGAVSNVLTTFTNGPLNGKGLREAVLNEVSGITFLGWGGAYLVFHDAVSNRIISYNYANLIWADLGLGPTSLYDPIPTDAYVYSQTLTSAVLGPDFLGIGDESMNFLDADGHLEWYYYIIGGLTGGGFYESDMSYLNGSQSGLKANNPNYLDAADGGYMFLDGDGTISWYYDALNTLYNDANWRSFTGGPLNGQAPSKSNIIATEDFGLYALEADGSLIYYNECDGKPLAVDLHTKTVLTGGPIDGKLIKDAVKNLIPGVRFLGISGDDMVFAVGVCAPVTGGGCPGSFTVISATPSACAPATNTYSLAGVIMINGQSFTPNGSGSETFTLTGLASNGATNVKVLATFANNAACTDSITYNAPASCTCPPNNQDFCPGDSFTLTADPAAINVQWYKDGSPIAGATAFTYIANALGAYHYEGTNNAGCPVAACCPVTLVAGNCTPTCPPVICLPITVVRN